MSSTDLQTFALVFAVFWGLLGAYLVYLHRLEERLRDEVERLRDARERGTPPPERPPT
ncbi:MAG: hypothetical protein ACYDCK_08465 [Thermoplasmatota archaeon]